jgi:hypothetical protein
MLLSVIGEGGFGIVYLAEQYEPLRRFVAVKVIRSELVSSTVLSRFEHECQALAAMDHPSVVSVLQSGLTEDGRPYLVMPLVPGLPVNRYCQERRLPPRELAGLFERIVRGVQHAHAQGVIHRDLKPANILVGDIDGVPTPRIIDFGLSKAVASNQTSLTTDGARVGTLQYMSPEHARGRPVDVRSDVFSLGLVLYELISGRPAISEERVALAVGLGSHQEIFRTPLPRPTAADGQRIPRELEWIAMKCLATDLERRYPTAAALAEDLRAFQAGGEIKAGPPARWYRGWSWIRRHRTAAAIVSVSVTALATIVIVSTVMAGRERAARQSSEQFALLSRSVIEGLDPVLAQGRDRSIIIEAMKRATQTADATELTPDVAVRTWTLFAEAYRNIGQMPDAMMYAERARQLASATYGEEDPRWLRAHALYVSAAQDVIGGDVLAEQLKPTGPLVIQRIKKCFPRGSRERGELLLMLNQFGWEWQGDEERNAALRELHEDLAQHIGAADRLTLRVARLRAQHMQPHWPEALDLAMSTRQLAEQAYGIEDPEALAGLSAESHILEIVKGPKAAAEHLKRYLPLTERVLGPDHRVVAISWYNLANALLLSDQAQEAAPIVQDNIARMTRCFGPESLFTAYAWGEAYLLALKSHNRTAASAALARLTDALRRKGDPNIPYPEMVLEYRSLEAIIYALDECGESERANQIVNNLQRTGVLQVNAIQAEREIRKRRHDAERSEP